MTKRSAGLLAIAIALFINYFLGIRKSMIMDFLSGILMGFGIMMLMGKEIKGFTHSLLTKLGYSKNQNEE